MRVQRALPIPVLLDGIELCAWPSKDPEDVMDTAVELLHMGYAEYVAKAPFLPFDEGSVNRVRRVARCIIGTRTLDLDALCDTYFRRHGRPEDEAR